MTNILCPPSVLYVTRPQPLGVRYNHYDRSVHDSGLTNRLRTPPLDVDLEHALLIVQPRDGWKPKGGARREIPMTTELVAIARQHATRFASASYMMPSPYVEDGVHPMTDETVNEHMERIVTDAGMVYGRADQNGVTYHTLRHTFASHLVVDGVDLKTVSRLMGHTTTKQVEKTYGHLSPEHRRAAVQRLGTRLQAAFAIEGEHE